MAKDCRKAKRSQQGAKAWVRLDGGFSVRPCVVADLSSTGVQVIMESPTIVAHTFTLMLARDARQGHRCRVKWRDGRRIGAEFVK